MKNPLSKLLSRISKPKTAVDPKEKPPYSEATLKKMDESGKKLTKLQEEIQDCYKKRKKYVEKNDSKKAKSEREKIIKLHEEIEIETEKSQKLLESQ